MSTIAIGDIAGRTPGSASPTKDGWPTPAISGGTIGIDTISHGVLTAVRMPAGDIIQSSRHKGRQR